MREEFEHAGCNDTLESTNEGGKNSNCCSFDGLSMNSSKEVPRYVKLADYAVKLAALSWRQSLEKELPDASANALRACDCGLCQFGSGGVESQPEACHLSSPLHRERLQGKVLDLVVDGPKDVVLERADERDRDVAEVDADAVDEGDRDGLVARLD